MQQQLDDVGFPRADVKLFLGHAVKNSYSQLKDNHHARMSRISGDMPKGSKNGWKVS